MKEYFGQEPKVLRNSSLIYSDDIGLQASQLGFKGMLTEGAKHVLGWKSPHYVYNCALAPNLKLLLRDVTSVIKNGLAILCLPIIILIALLACLMRRRW